MKSLALHLIAILLLGSLHIIANRNFMLLVATTISASSTVVTVKAVASLPTTTQQSPSLRATLATLPITTETSSSAAAATTTRRQQRQLLLTRRSSPAHANAGGSLNTSMTNNNNTLTSNTRNLRQNRSLQSASVAIAQHNINNNNAAVIDNNKNSNINSEYNKHKHSERRQYLRTHQTTPALKTTLTVSSSASTSTTTLTPIANEHQSMSTFITTNHRKSKESSMPLDGASDAMEENTAQQTSDYIKQPQTLKTPRMIQRLVAGHIQNAEGHSTYQVSAVSTNSSISNSSTSTSTTLKPTSHFFRRKQPLVSSSYRKVSTTTAKPGATVSEVINANHGDSENDDDEALLDDPGDFDNWDNGILRLSAGSGKEISAKSKKSKDDSKKTLSDQVRDGKYGLIEKEIFRREPKRPGVLSYLPNKEVPEDNEKNFGGLDEEDIWLAEDHLLVIKGGSLNDDELNEPWPPIDDYDAPGRQIKIPPKPKVPPPFPVQLEENGPVQFIGNNKFTIVFPIANESIPIYPAGPETNDPPAESDGDNEKNLIARPGSAQDTTEGGPGYIYPAPYPPWLYHNQTFANPFLSHARPITFPGLGPFPFGRNGSLENRNVTEDFDEDDPSLYYPPAYSFVYKSNYSNPVPPGPLVPGIVLPPPANQFSRLNKDDKIALLTPPSSPPPRHRPTTTTTTSTTTSTTTARPYGQVITKISEYTPKTIIITPVPPAIPSSSTPSTKAVTPATKYLPTPPTTPPSSLQPPIDSIPVPVAVPIPVYPSGNYPRERPNIISFVPTTPEPNTDSFSKSNPIYYDYFEAKRQPVASNVIDEFLSTTVKPPTNLRPIKLYATSKRPLKSQNYRNYLEPISNIPKRPYVPEEIVYITPKPEVRFQVPVEVPVFRQRPLENFESEVNAIRETLRYYQNQQLRDNSIPRAPKAKPIYEYAFDSNKNLQAATTPEVSGGAAGNFQPPSEYDEEPFKPMVTYSPPVGDENSFRALAYDKVDSEGEQQPAQQREEPSPTRYQGTTTLVPVPAEPQYQKQQGRMKKHRLRSKYLQQPIAGDYEQQQPNQEQSLNYITTSQRPPLATQAPWVSVNKQEFSEFLSREQQRKSERLQLAPPSPLIGTKHRSYHGYYYGPPPPPARQNQRFYNEPFQPPVRNIVNYRPQPIPQQQQQQQQSQPQQSNIWSLENDTYVNYAPNRPPLNPDAEFINPYQTFPGNVYNNRYQTSQQAQALPPISHQSQYFGPPQRYPIPPQRQQQQQQQQIPLHRDILVNYRQPLPPINPDSEYISHPNVVRNQANQIYRSNGYRLPIAAATVLGEDDGRTVDQSNVYYLTPKYRRSNNNNNNKNNNQGNQEQDNNRGNNDNIGK